MYTRSTTTSKLGPHVCLSDVSSVCSLSEIETWAVLCLSVQKLQDSLLKSAGSKENTGCWFTPSVDNLLLHASGAISTEEPIYAYANYAYRNTSKSILGFSDRKGAELGGLAAIGKILLKSAQTIISSDLRTLLKQMSEQSTDLVQVLRCCEHFWRRHKTVPVSQVVAKIYKNTITAYTKSSILDDRHTVTNRVLTEINHKPFVTDRPRNTTTIITTNINSNNRRRDTVALDNIKTESFTNQRRYGKRYEFRPPLTEKMSRKFGDLDPNKSLSTSAIDQELRDFAQTAQFPAKNHRTTGALRRIEPEYNQRARKAPVKEHSLAKNEANAVAVVVRVLSGDNIRLRIDENTKVEDVLTYALAFAGLQSLTEPVFCLCSLKDKEYFYLPGQAKLAKLFDDGDIEPPPPAKDDTTAGGGRKTRSRPRRSSVGADHRSVVDDGKTTFYVRFREVDEQFERFNLKVLHYLCLQLRQDFLKGLYRMSVEDHCVFGAAALRADIGVGELRSQLHLEQINVSDYLPELLILHLGEKRAKEKLSKMARTFQLSTGDTFNLELYLINWLKRSSRLSSFSYLESNKTLELRVEKVGLSLVEVNPDRFLAGKLLKTISWINLKELKRAGDHIQFFDAGAQCKVKLGFGSRTKRVFDLLDVLCKKNAPQVDAPERGKKIREFYQKLRSHVTDPGSRREIKKKRRSLPSFGSEFRGSLLQSKTRCSIRRLKHYSSMANSLLAKSSTDITSDAVASKPSSGSSSGTSRRSGTSLAASLRIFNGTSSSSSATDQSTVAAGGAARHLAKPSPPPLEDRGNLKKLKLDRGQADRTVGSGAPLDSAYRYRVYLENQDYEDHDTSMEMSNLVEDRKRSKRPQASRQESKKGRLGKFSLKGSMAKSTEALPQLQQDSLPHHPPTAFANWQKMFRSCDDIAGITAAAEPPFSWFQQTNTAIAATAVDTKNMSRRAVVKVTEPIVGNPSASAGESLDTSLSVSLLERFNNMDTADWEPSRRITRVILRRNKRTGRLGVRITETPSGIYVEGIEDGDTDGGQASSEADSGVSSVTDSKSSSSCMSQTGDQLKVGDKILEVEGILIDGLGYSTVLQIIRNAGETVEFLVSQLVED